jgi:nitrile hydratase
MSESKQTRGGDHDHSQPGDPLAVRAEALEELLGEQGLVSREAVDAIIRQYEEDVGPMNGARVVARAWIVVVENTPEVHNVVVCSLCSCYPWPVLGLPPAWYKDPAYRSRVVREPRRVLAEFGLALADDVEVRVWDSSAEIRYLVLPERHPGAEALGEAELAELVSRDAMIGVARVEPPR